MKATFTSALLLAALSGTMLVSAGQASAADLTGLDGTSTADFTVSTKTDPTDPTDPNGKLVLQAVPSFNYGEVKASDIYSGFNDKAATTAGDIKVSDTRTGSDNWQLTASMSPFAAGSSTLSGAALTLGATTSPIGANFAGATITDEGAGTIVAEGIGTLHGVNVFTMAPAASTLTLGANADAALADKAAYSADITWTLSSDGPTAPVVTP
ncbi:Cell surface protein, CscB family [Paucilactobacillus oligofermentans DSM 15707 = LMG 22743]|nr:Cell surface protein, CscB family [Paucilactobacillus oligofermentans DSM 15707 = LMG 22743]